MTICTLIFLCTFVYYLLKANDTVWEDPNLYVTLLKQIAQKENIKNCWACGMKPKDSKELPLVAIPVKSDVIVHQNLIGQNVTTGRGTTQRIRVLKTMSGSKLTICININRSHERPQTFLGKLPPSYCSDAPVVLSMPWKNTEEGRKRSDDSWSLMCHMILARGQPGYVNYPSEIGINKTLRHFSLPGRPNLTACWNVLQLELAMIGAGAPLNVSRLMFPQGLVTLRPPYYFVCGRWAYAWLPTSSYGRCTIATLAPAIAILEEKNMAVEKYLVPRPYRRNMKRFITYIPAWVWFPSWNGWNMEDIVGLNNYSGIIESMFNETRAATPASSVDHKLAFHRKLAEDYNLAVRGGMCVIVEGDCCTWISDSEDMTQSHKNKLKEIQNKARETGQGAWIPLEGLTIRDLFAAIGMSSGEVNAFIITISTFILLRYFS